MAFHHSPKIVTNGLVLCLDAANRKSYSGTGTTWTDLAGTNNGTLVNGPTFSSANGGSIVFDGVDDYVDCGNNIPKTLVGLTIDILLKVGRINTKQAILTTYYSGLGWGLEILNDNTVNIFGFQSVGSAVGVTSLSTISLNNFYHITGTFLASSSFNIYINGVLTNTGATNFTSITRNLSRTLKMGKDVDQGISFGGNIYNAKIYNRALTSAEVLQNYNATKGRFGL